jgi:hypothetical protein
LLVNKANGFQRIRCAKGVPKPGVKEEAANFVASYLKRDSDMPMREPQDSWARLGMNVDPLIMGLALTRLGKGRPKSSNVCKPSAASRVSRATTESASNSKDPSSLVDNFVAHMKRLEQVKQTLRTTLQRIAEVVGREAAGLLAGC